ncbi:MAG: hypothetical protein ABEJ05_12795 [Haloglomus sp.]
MPSTRMSRVWNWLTAKQQLVSLAAVLVALPASYAFRATFGEYAGSFLLLVLLGVGVPSAREEYWPRSDRTRAAMAWALGACAATAAVFVGCYLVGTAIGLGPFFAGVGAFLVTHAGVLVVCRRQGRG